MTIWKFALDTFTTQLPLPSTAEFLRCGVQGDSVVIWVKSYPYHAVTKGRTIQVFMTGEEIPDGLSYIDTVQLPTGIVAHIFEVG